MGCTMKRITKLAVAVTITGLLSAGGVLAQTAQQFAEQREAQMKQIGAAMRTLTAVGRGEAPIDAPARTAGTTLAATTKSVFTLFPPGSAAGRADPKIWTDRAAFDAEAQKLQAAADKALAALNANDQRALSAALAEAGATCAACHRGYRKAE